MKKVFIDGSEGTTGLRIFERFEQRDDVEILRIAPELRKDVNERKRLINASDITFLCLPDAAAMESVSLIDADNDHTVIIDTSTAHRISEGWSYGFPELSAAHRERIVNGKRIAVPGCHASGFIALVYPAVSGGLIPADYPVSAMSLSGYSGAGKKAIAVYESDEKPAEFDSPRLYGLAQTHKHLPEMKAICGLTKKPLFMPVVDDYYSGMIVSVPIYADMMAKKMTVEEVRAFYKEFYKDSTFISVADEADETQASGFVPANQFSGKDSMRIYISGNEERIQLTSHFDNLGKGASGAAMQCMNLVLGCEETKGLQL